MDVAVGMPDLCPFVKSVKSAVSHFHGKVQRRALLKRILRSFRQEFPGGW